MQILRYKQKMGWKPILQNAMGRTPISKMTVILAKYRRI
jgi:hypothetical protein